MVKGSRAGALIFPTPEPRPAFASGAPCRQSVVVTYTKSISGFKLSAALIEPGFANLSMFSIVQSSMFVALKLAKVYKMNIRSIADYCACIPFTRY